MKVGRTVRFAPIR